MKSIQIVILLLIFSFPVFTQNNQLIRDVPSLEIADFRLDDENGNRIIEANETCDLHLMIKNSGGLAANNVKVKLSLTDPEDLDLRYRKTRIISSLKAGTEEDLLFPIAAGAIVQDGLATFKIEISEQNGYDAFPSNLEIETAQGNVVINNSVEGAADDREEEEAQPMFSLVELHLDDYNENNILDANETSELKLRIWNLIDQTIEGSELYIDPVEGNTNGIIYPRRHGLPPFEPLVYQDITIPVRGSKELTDGDVRFAVYVVDSKGRESEHQVLDIRTQAYSEPVLRVSSAEFKGESDAVPRLGEEINLKFILENAGSGSAFDLEVEPRVTDKNVKIETSRSALRFAEIPGGGAQEINIKMVADRDYMFPNIPVVLEITENFNNLTLDTLLIASIELSEYQPQDISTEAHSEPVLSISRAEFTGESDGIPRLGEEINLKFLLENTGSGPALDLEVEPRVTDTNVKIETSRSALRINEIPGGGSQEVNIKMVAGQEYMFPKIPVMLEITENSNNLFLDTMLIASLAEAGIPTMENEVIRVTPVLPPNLVLQDLQFTDDNNNRLIDHKESCEIKFSISNTGEGPARDISVIIDQLNSDISGLSFQDSMLVGDLNPNQQVAVSIPIRSTGINGSDIAEFNIRVMESNGWDAALHSIQVETRGLLEPHLYLSRVEFRGESGPLRRNEDIVLDVTVSNDGPGDASDVQVKFALPDNPYIFLMGDAVDQFDINRLRSGESQNLSISFTASRRYTDSKIPVNFEVSESYRQFGIDTLLTGLMEEEEMVAQTLVIEPVIPEPQAMTRQEIETDEPADTVPRMRGGGDPLKGLGYEEAISGLDVGRYYALIIGIDSYSGEWPQLGNAVNDARALQRILNTDYEFNEIRTLFEDQATMENILYEFDLLSRKVTPEDNVLIYYSGHGEFRDDMNMGFWVPYGVNRKNFLDYIENTTIRNKIYGIKSKHTLLISDACFGGDIFQTVRGQIISSSPDKSPRHYREVYERTSRKALTSGELERVSDNGIEGHSIFSYYLLNTLENNQDRLFDASQLYDSLKLPVYNNSHHNPQYETISNTGDTGGQFVFIRK